MKTELIALDWGITTFRAYRLDAHGKVMEIKSEPAGILRIPEGQFENRLVRLMTPWLKQGEPAPVIASGMITSKQGWIETDYLECPAGLSQLAEHLVAHTTHAGWKVYFVPGFKFTGPGNVPDVMRGEETQVFGALGPGDKRRLLILPGTHSKWVESRGPILERFATFMTGEVYAVLKDHTILGKLADKGVHDTEAFRRGTLYGLAVLENTGGLLHRLFSARSLALFDHLHGSSVESYLSGLLIGAEIREGLNWTRDAAKHDSVTLVGNNQLTELYQKAFLYAGLAAQKAQEACTAVGLYRIARAAGLMEGSHGPV